jgi:hypothetical protein
LGIAVVSDGLSELIEGDYFADETNKTCLQMPGWLYISPHLQRGNQNARLVHPNSYFKCIIFTIIINSYCPMSISMFRYLQKILSETMSITKGVEKIQENQEKGVELINILSSKHPPNSKPSVSSDPKTPLPKKSDNPYCLWCWIVICIFYGCVAALFIAAVFLSLIISLMELVMEPQCEKVECQLSNGESSSWGHVSAAASIYAQDENGTTLVMP